MYSHVALTGSARSLPSPHCAAAVRIFQAAVQALAGLCSDERVVLRQQPGRSLEEEAGRCLEPGRVCHAPVGYPVGSQWTTHVGNTRMALPYDSAKSTHRLQCPQQSDLCLVAITSSSSKAKTSLVERLTELAYLAVNPLPGLTAIRALIRPAVVHSP